MLFQSSVHRSPDSDHAAEHQQSSTTFPSSPGHLSKSSKTSWTILRRKRVNSMGASQSKIPEPVIEEQLVESLRALDLKETRAEAEKDYVYVDDSKPSDTKYSPTVSVTTAEQWEKELLEDPKASHF